MVKAFTIGCLGGVPLRLNPLFLLLLLWYFWVGWLPQALVAFSLVLLHEMAHVAVAVAYGFKVVEVELFPFGGVARVAQPVEHDPWAEMLIAGAGPLVNLVLAVIGLLLFLEGIWDHHVVPFFLEANLGLALFNLLPALPLDGGRICRAAATRHWGLKEATEGAAFAGQVLGLFLGAVGLLGMWFGALDMGLLWASVFLFYAASRERGYGAFFFMGFINRKRSELDTRGSLPTRQVAALPSTLLKDLTRYLTPRKYLLVVVVDEGGRPLGMVSETQVIDGFFQGGPAATLAHILGPKL